jgi:hypothetical protein
MNLSCGSGMGNAQLLAHWANRFRCELVELLLRLPECQKGASGGAQAVHLWTLDTPLEVEGVPARGTGAGGSLGLVGVRCSWNPFKGG